MTPVRSLFNIHRQSACRCYPAPPLCLMSQPAEVWGDGRAYLEGWGTLSTATETTIGQYGLSHSDIAHRDDPRARCRPKMVLRHGGFAGWPDTVTAP